jgi:hypothetical protein
MWLPLLALSTEVAFVIMVWRATRLPAGLAAKFVATMLGLAAGASIGLGVECGYFLYIGDEVIRPDIQFMIFWLLAGVLGFAAAMIIRPTQISGTLPCLLLALLCLIYAWHFDDAVWVATGLGLATTAAILWLLTALARAAWRTSRSKLETASSG